MYYRGASGALLVYDITDKDSFTKIQTWHLELRKYLGDQVPIMIAGNKCDIGNFAVSKEVGEQFAHQVGSEHVFTSAKTGKGVEEVFRKLVNCKLNSILYLFRNGAKPWLYRIDEDDQTNG